VVSSLNSCFGTESTGDEQSWGESREAAAPHGVKQGYVVVLCHGLGFQGTQICCSSSAQILNMAG